MAKSSENGKRMVITGVYYSIIAGLNHLTILLNPYNAVFLKPLLIGDHMFFVATLLKSVDKSVASQWLQLDSPVS